MADGGLRLRVRSRWALGQRREAFGTRLGLCLGVWVLGCTASASVRPSGTPDAGAVEPAAPSAFSRGLGSVEAVGQGLEFPLPDRAGWRRDTAETRSWVAQHRATGSRLVVRAWQHDSIARAVDCEQQARMWRADLPELTPADVLEARERTIGGLYQSQITLGVQADETGAGLVRGHALAFGSDARSCLMLVFSTASSGPNALREVAERLGIVDQAVFGRVRRLGIHDRVVVPRL
jgi:hypothetical protein